MKQQEEEEEERCTPQTQQSDGLIIGREERCMHFAPRRSQQPQQAESSDPRSAQTRQNSGQVPAFPAHTHLRHKRASLSTWG